MNTLLPEPMVPRPALPCAHHSPPSALQAERNRCFVSLYKINEQHDVFCCENVRYMMGDDLQKEEIVRYDRYEKEKRQERNELMNARPMCCEMVAIKLPR